MARFTYIVWSPQGEKPPTVTYNYRWKAENEAKRLSIAHPDKVFHVCKIKSATVSGQSAYFGKWRPNKSGAAKRKQRSATNVDYFAGKTWDIEVYARPADSSAMWTPINDLSFEAIP